MKRLQGFISIADFFLCDFVCSWCALPSFNHFENQYFLEVDHNAIQGIASRFVILFFSKMTWRGILCVYKTCYSV